MAIQLNQIIDNLARNELGSVPHEELDNLITLIDNQFDKPLDVTLSSTTITIETATKQKLESDGADSTQNSYKWRLPPLNEANVNPAESTLDLSDGSVTGDFDTPVESKSMTASYWIQMGIELREDGKFYIVWGDENSAKASTTLPKFNGDALPILVAFLQDDGTGGTWNFNTPTKPDIELISVGGGAGGGGGVTDLKLGSITANTTIVKKGFIRDNQGKLYGLETDLTLNLKTQVNNNGVTTPTSLTTYWLYLDTHVFTNLTTATTAGLAGLKYYQLTTGTSGPFIIFTTSPQDTDLYRYYPIAVLKSDAGSNYSERKDYPVKHSDTIPADNSFKILKVINDGTTTIQGGFIFDGLGREFGTFIGGVYTTPSNYGKNITISLATLVPSPVDYTTYWLYIDTSTCTRYTPNRNCYPVEEANFVANRTTPEEIDLTRYIPIGNVFRGNSTWSSAWLTFAAKKHPWLVEDQFENYIINPNALRSAAEGTLLNDCVLERVVEDGSTLSKTHFKVSDLDSMGVRAVWYTKKIDEKYNGQLFEFSGTYQYNKDVSSTGDFVFRIRVGAVTIVDTDVNMIGDGEPHTFKRYFRADTANTYSPVLQPLAAGHANDEILISNVKVTPVEQITDSDNYVINPSAQQESTTGVDAGTGGWDVYTTTEGLPSNTCAGIHRLGKYICVATSGGVAISDDEGATWTTYTTSNSSLPDNDTRGIFKYGDLIYIATMGGLAVFDTSDSTWDIYTTTQGLPSNSVYSAYVNSNGIYLGTQGGFVISTNGGSSWTTRTATDGLPNTQVNNAYAVGTTYYAATSDGAAKSTNGGTSWTSYKTTEGLPHNTSWGIRAEGDLIYVGTQGGLAKSTNGGTSWTSYTTANGMPNNVCRFIHLKNGVVYIATMGGVAILKEDAFTTYTVSNSDLPNNTCVGIYADGGVYVATSGGVGVKSFAFVVTKGTDEDKLSANYFNLAATNILAGASVDWELDTLQEKHNNRLMMFSANVKLVSSQGSGLYKVGLHDGTDYVAGTEFDLLNNTVLQVKSLFVLDTSKTYTVRVESTDVGHSSDVVYIDEVKVTSEKAIQSVPFTDWQSIELDLSSSNLTSPTQSMFYSQRGETMILRGIITNGSGAVGGNIVLGLPTGFDINYSQLPVSTDSPLGGYASALDSSTPGKHIGIASTNGTSTKQFVIQGDDGAGKWSADVPFVWANADRIEINCIEIPISQWQGMVVTTNNNRVQYLTNSSTDTDNTAADRLTAFAYGASGAPIRGVSAANTECIKRVRSQRPITLTDVIELYINDGEIPVKAANKFPLIEDGTARYGMGWKRVAGSLTDIDIIFGGDGARQGETWASHLMGGDIFWQLNISSNPLGIGASNATPTEIGAVYSTVGGYTKFIGGVNSSGTFAEVTANLVAGDKVLMTVSQIESADVDITVSDVSIDMMPNVALKFSGLTNGLKLSGSRISISGKIETQVSGTSGLYVAGDDCYVSKLLITAKGGTLTNAVMIPSGGDRNYVEGSLVNDGGTITNKISDSGSNNDWSLRGAGA